MSNNPFMTGAPVPGGAPMPGMPSNSAENFEVDLSGVEVNSYVIPDGNYKVKCVEVEQSVSKGGNPMFVWTFEISEGDRAGFQSKVFTAITPAAMWKVAETVIALGIGQTGETVKFNRSDVIGKECGAIFEQTDYNGKVNSQITKVISLKELAESRA